MKKRIVVTGMGVCTPAGIGVSSYWEGLLKEKSYVTEITKFDASRYPSHIAGEIKDLDDHHQLDRRLIKKMDRFSVLGLVASEQAVQDAQLDFSKVDTDRVGVFIGNVLGGWQFAEDELRDSWALGIKEVSPYMASAWFPAAPQGQISIYYKLCGYGKTIISDRASGVMSLGYAARTIAKGAADVILAGGVEAPVTPYALLCCVTSGDLTTENSNPAKAYRPYDKNRRGLVIGEGAGILVLEDYEHARRRGVPIYGEIVGFGNTCDGVHYVRCAEDGVQMARAITLALKEAQLQPQDLGAVIADGAAKPSEDVSETKALKLALGDYAKKIPISASKSMTGHLMGAQGVVDAVTALLAMEKGIIPPTINLETPDPECDLDYVPGQGRNLQADYLLINSRGRGGVNAALVIKKGI